jgi:ABC-type transporter Mla subunit MlaD
MSEEMFRWVITVGVALSWLMTAITAGAMFAVYRTSKRMEGRVTMTLDKAEPILDTTRSMVNDARPKIEEMISQAQAMTASAREQVARLDALVIEATDRARVQIDRIDVMVGDTVDRVQETTAAVQNTILRPVREVNGVVSGVRAAISVLARGNRASVDHATQDEEMFI